jgi:hypothetical protein
VPRLLKARIELSRRTQQAPSATRISRPGFPQDEARIHKMIGLMDDHAMRISSILRTSLRSYERRDTIIAQAARGLSSMINR